MKVDVPNLYNMIIVDSTGSRRNDTNTILRCTLITFSMDVHSAVDVWIFFSYLCNIKEVLLCKLLKSFLCLIIRNETKNVYYMTCWLVISNQRFGGACLHLRIVQEKLVTWKKCLHYTRKEHALLPPKNLLFLAYLEDVSGKLLPDIGNWLPINTVSYPERP